MWCWLVKLYQWTTATLEEKVNLFMCTTAVSLWSRLSQHKSAVWKQHWFHLVICEATNVTTQTSTHVLKPFSVGKNKCLILYPTMSWQGEESTHGQESKVGLTQTHTNTLAHSPAVLTFWKIQPYLSQMCSEERNPWKSSFHLNLYPRHVFSWVHLCVCVLCVCDVTVKWICAVLSKSLLLQWCSCSGKAALWV